MVTPESGNNSTGATSGAKRSTSRTHRIQQGASEAYNAARQRTTALYGSARERASSAYGSTRAGAARVGRRTADEIDANPFAAIAGGLALGALAAALLPRTRREDERLGPIGSRINDRARDAALAARDAGREKLDELGFSREAAREKLSEIASRAGEAVRTSAKAAARSKKK